MIKHFSDTSRKVSIIIVYIMTTQQVSDHYTYILYTFNQEIANMFASSMQISIVLILRTKISYTLLLYTGQSKETKTSDTGTKCTDHVQLKHVRNQGLNLACATAVWNAFLSAYILSIDCLRK